MGSEMCIRDRNTREGLRLSLEDEFDVYISSNIKGAKDVLDNEHIDVLVTDLRLGAEDGMELIELALKMPQPPISIMMTAYGSVDTAVEAMKRGAYHFVTKPLNIDQFGVRLTTYHQPTVHLYLQEVKLRLLRQLH